MKQLAFAMAMIGVIFLAGCKPKPIEGQIFIVSEARINFPLGAVEIDAVDARSADNFFQKRQSEIQDKAKALKTFYDNAEVRYKESIITYNKCQVKAASNDYTNDPEFIKLMNQKSKDLQSEEALQRYERVLQERLSRSMMTTATGQSASIASEIREYGAEEEVYRNKVLGAEIRCGQIQTSYLTPLEKALVQAQQALSDAQSTLDSCTYAYTNFPSANDYFEGFSPQHYDSTVSDLNGNFILKKPYSNIKIFAKAQRQILDSLETYYWLVNPPSDGQKLILSNNNLFIPPS